MQVRREERCNEPLPPRAVRRADLLSGFRFPRYHRRRHGPRDARPRSEWRVRIVPAHDLSAWLGARGAIHNLTLTNRGRHTPARGSPMSFRCGECVPAVRACGPGPGREQRGPLEPEGPPLGQVIVLAVGALFAAQSLNSTSAAKHLQPCKAAINTPSLRTSNMPSRTQTNVECRLRRLAFLLLRSSDKRAGRGKKTQTGARSMLRR